MKITENPYVSDVAKVIQGSKTRYLTELASQYGDAVSFAVGEPDFTTPGHIIEAAAKKLLEGETHYAPNPGIYELRQVIAEEYNRKHPKQRFSAANVVVTNGTQEANLLSMMAILNPGDEVLVPTPNYISYIPQLLMLHVKAVFVKTYAENGYEITAEAIEAAVTPRTRAVMLNSPCNPTGTVLSRETLEQVIETAKRHKLAILSDETYSEIVYEPFTSILDVMELDESLFYCSGFSKSYAMTGWRLGYTITTEETALAIRYLHENSTSCSNTALQYGAVEAVKNGAEDVEYMRRKYKERRNLICSLLDEIGPLSYVLPRGAFYVWVDIRETGLSSMDFADRLLRETHTVVAPGTAFGEAGEGFIRLSYATSEEKIEEGLKRIGNFVKTLR